MVFSRTFRKGDGPTRLFVGGVHGKEGKTTITPIKYLKDDDLVDGNLILFNCDESRYISTLDHLYYSSPMGMKILKLIKTYEPEIYVELHCYKPESYYKLVDRDRKKRAGVPPLIEMEKGVLMSSISPYLRTNFFERNDICITLEMPCHPSKDVCSIYLELMKVIAGSRNRKELEDRLIRTYPSQVLRAQRYAADFFGEYPAF